ncbi:MAG TPA: BrxE family protein [bacterium]|nr:BrxE family protein [bacterium]
MSQKNAQLANTLSVLRLLVGYLGEKPQFAWWDTNFLSPIGQQFMTINFPRTALSAGIQAVSDAARRLHDERIGKGGVYHLFRLPTALEEDIHQIILQGHPHLAVARIQNRESALDELKNQSSDITIPGSGPVLLGKISELENGPTLGRLAALYHQAFAAGTSSFPYFSHE